MSDSLGIDDQMMGFPLLPAGNDIIDDTLFIKIIFFRQKHIFRAIGDPAPQCDISGMSPHYFDDTASLMGG